MFGSCWFMGAETSWAQHVLWRKQVWARNRELPAEKQSKGRWIQSVSGAQVSYAITIAEHPHAAQLGGGKGEMTFAIPFLRFSVLSSSHKLTSCVSSAVPSSPREFLGWWMASNTGILGSPVWMMLCLPVQPEQDKGPCEYSFIRATALFSHRHSIWCIFLIRVEKTLPATLPSSLPWCESNQIDLVHLQLASPHRLSTKLERRKTEQW